MGRSALPFGVELGPRLAWFGGRSIRGTVRGLLAGFAVGAVGSVFVVVAGQGRIVAVVVPGVPTIVVVIVAVGALAWPQRALRACSSPYARRQSARWA